MNKAELIAAVADATGLTKTKAGEALDAVLTTVQGSLIAGNEVALVGFGTFSVKERAARTGRNPQTGAPIEIAAARSVAFKAGKGLKEAIN